MRGVTLVGVDTTMCTICAAASFGSLLDDNVLDEEIFYIDVFGISVRFGVLEQACDEFHRLLGPATLRGFELLSLTSPANTARESSERNDALVFQNCFEVCICFCKFHAR